MRGAAADLLGLPPIEDALAICLLLLDQEPERYERASVRRLGRHLLERRAMSLRQAEFAAAYLAACRDPGRREEAAEALANLFGAPPRPNGAPRTGARQRLCLEPSPGRSWFSTFAALTQTPIACWRAPGRRPKGRSALAGAEQALAPRSSCMQEPRPMLHQHGVQRAARATGRARRPRISPSLLAHSGDVLDQRRALARAQGALSRAERRFPTWPRRRWSGPEAAGLLPNAAAKFGVGASSVSRALAKQDGDAPMTS